MGLRPLRYEYKKENALDLKSALIRIVFGTKIKKLVLCLGVVDPNDGDYITRLLWRYSSHLRAIDFNAQHLCKEKR